MRMIRLTFATLLLGAGVAAAQPEEDLEEPPPPPPPKPKAERPAIRRPPPSPPSTVPSTPIVPIVRPTGSSIGLGVGWNFPTDLQVPNAFSARFRVGSGLTIEPELALARGDLSREDGLPPPENVTTTEITLGMQVRKPLRERGKADLELIGGIRLAQESYDPEGDGNTDSSIAFSLNYGLAVGVWLTPHMQLSVTAVNPIFLAAKDTDEQGFGVDPIKTTSTTIGAVWDPDFIVMLHLHL